MIPLIFLLAMHVVAVKVFKKTSPNGKTNNSETYIQTSSQPDKQ